MALYMGSWELVPAHKSHRVCLCLRERENDQKSVHSFLMRAGRGKSRVGCV